MDPLFWSILLIVLGLVLIGVEVFVPTGGVLGVISISARGGFDRARLLPSGGRGRARISCLRGAGRAPAVVVAAFRYWPRTPMGRRLLLGAPSGEEVLPDDPERRQLANWWASWAWPSR